VQLPQCLRARISGIGSHLLVVEGVERCTVRVDDDPRRIEAAPS